LKFNGDRFLKNLKKYEINENNKSESSNGMARVLEHMWMHSHPSDINFESFDLIDIDLAIDELESLPLTWDEGGEHFLCDPSNGLMIIDQLTDIAYGFAKTKNKIFHLEEDDLFL
jgi:hypothetical protein